MDILLRKRGIRVKLTRIQSIQLAIMVRIMKMRPQGFGLLPFVQLYLRAFLGPALADRALKTPSTHSSDEFRNNVNPEEPDFLLPETSEARKAEKPSSVPFAGPAQPDLILISEDTMEIEGTVRDASFGTFTPSTESTEEHIQSTVQGLKSLGISESGRSALESQPQTSITSTLSQKSDEDMRKSLIPHSQGFEGQDEGVLSQGASSSVCEFDSPNIREREDEDLEAALSGTVESPPLVTPTFTTDDPKKTEVLGGEAGSVVDGSYRGDQEATKEERDHPPTTPEVFLDGGAEIPPTQTWSQPVSDAEPPRSSRLDESLSESERISESIADGDSVPGPLASDISGNNPVGGHAEPLSDEEGPMLFLPEEISAEEERPAHRPEPNVDYASDASDEEDSDMEHEADFGDMVRLEESFETLQTWLCATSKGRNRRKFKEMRDSLGLLVQTAEGLHTN